MNKVTVGKATLNLIDCNLEKNKTGFKADLLKIVRDSNVLEYPSVIDEKASLGGKEGYQYLYHLSEIRGNVIRWLPIKKNDSVLEVEAECGAITSALNELSENVTVTASSATDAEIIAERFSNCKNFVIFAGDKKQTLQAIEAENTGFDWIIIRDPYLLKESKKLLKPTGKMVFICDNRMAMRNLAGVKADGAEEYFSGVEGKTESGFTYVGLLRCLAMLGYPAPQLFFPYPDYRFTKTVYSTKRYPKTGELVDNLRNFDADRLQLFNEKNAFDACIEDGSFPEFSNSYIAVLNGNVDTLYARFSNDRAPEYQIFTSIEETNGLKTVRKQPLTEAAGDHIRKLADYYEKLSNKYAGSKLRINKCNLLDLQDRVSASFEYVQGVELTELLDLCLQKNDTDSFFKYFDKYVKLVGFNDDMKFADLDVVFSNILVSRDDQWTLIDYEWCKETSVPIKETAYRAIYCYLLEDGTRNKFNLDLVRSKLVLSKEASEDIEADEMEFQKRVTAKNLSLSEIRERLGFNVINPLDNKFTAKNNKEIYKFQIYPGGPNSEFSEETSWICKDAYTSESSAEVTAGVMAEDRVMRFDPLDAPCIVTIRECKLGELDFPFDNKKYVICNGKRVGKDTFVFSTSDPNLYFNLDGFIHDEDTFMYIKMDIIPVPTDTAKSIEDNIKKIF